MTTLSSEAQAALADLLGKIERGEKVVVDATPTPAWYASLSGYFRMALWGVAALALAYLVWNFAAAQIGVGLWKAALVVSAGYAGYWLDRHLFPYARPHTQVADDQPGMWNGNDSLGIVFAASQLRRALIVTGMMLSVATAL